MIQTHVIQQFKFHEKYIAIDWDDLKRAIEVTIPDGIASVFIEPVDKVKYEDGMWFAIIPADITKFVFQKESVEEVGEIFLLTNDKKVSLGITRESEAAQKWVSIANQVIEKAKSKY